MQMKIERLDHLGVVAGILKELELSKAIDALLPPTDDMKASVGECVAAMILCGLGFSQTPLSLTPHFFEKLPVGFLLGNDQLQAQDLNHFKLGRSLEKLHEYGCEKLFAELSHKACQKESVDTQWSHGDTTSFSFSGKYASDEEAAEVEINHGYSRDHRPDLVQIVQEMLVSDSYGIPLGIKHWSGNSNDSEIFHQRIQTMSQNLNPNVRGIILDSKGYNQRNEPYLKNLGFISRVPATLKAHEEMVVTALGVAEWQTLSEGEYWQEFAYEDERWIIVYSSAAEHRSQKALAYKCEHENEELQQTLKKLQRKRFNCQADAEQALQEAFKKAKYHSLKSFETVAVQKQAQRGRPKEGQEKITVNWRIQAEFELDEDKTVGLDAEGACYIVVTNLPAQELPATEAIALYKQQSKVERGFRFLKDPQFFTSALFLKKPERVQGLLTVMTLALLVYSLAERRLRMALAQKNETLPNQIKQETATPTLRWVFYLLKDINRVFLEIPGQPKQCLMEGMNDLKTKILRLFGPQVELNYQLTPSEGCSM